MEQSELYLLLKTFEKNDLDNLKNFIQIDFTGKARYRSQAKTLLQILHEHFSSGMPKDLSKESIFQHVFPNQSVSINQVERVMHELLQVVRQFLLFKDHFQESKAIERQIQYAAILKNKGIEHKAAIHITHALKEIEDIPVRGPKHFSAGFDASFFQYSLNSENTKWKDDLQIASTLRYLDLYYMSQKLQLVNHYLLLNAFSKVEKNDETSNVNTHIEIAPAYLEKEPYLNICYKIYLLLSNPKPTKEGFEELLHILARFEDSIEPDSVRMSYGYLRNYCILLIRAGYRDLHLTLHTIMVENLKKGYVLYEGKMPIGGYYNFANVAIRAGCGEWAIKFADQYKGLVLGTQHDVEEVYNLIFSQYFHYAQDYEKALAFLPQASQNLLRNLAIRMLEIMIYFDQGSTLFHYKLDAFKMYISRASKKLISDDTRDGASNFINILLQIANVAPGDQERVNKILSRINAKTYVAEKEWLLKKLEEIARKR